MIDELELSEQQAEQIVQKAIDFQVYTDDMPDNKKGKLEAAHEVVAFTIDSWQQENPDPDTEAGKEMVEMLNLADVTINDDGTVNYGSANGDESEDDSADDDSGEESEDEAPFDIDSYIEGYSELTAATRIKKIKAKELDPDDDDDYNTLVSIAEWEESQEQPSSRVLDYLNEIIPPADEDEDEESDSSSEDADAEDEATPEEDSSDDEAEEEEPEAEAGDEEPWTEDSLKALDREGLKEVAAKFEVEFPQRLTGPGKRKVIDKILEAQPDDEEEPEEPEAEGDGGEAESLDEPWDGYNDASDDDIITVINDIDEYVEGDPTEALEYVKRYEESMEESSEAVLEAIENALNEDESEEAGEEEPEAEQEEESSDDDAEQKEDKPQQGSHLGQLADAAVKSSEHHALLRKAGLGAPPDFEGDMPELPGDIDAVDHSQLSNLMHSFQNALSTCAWQASMAYIEADMFEEIADFLENRALLSSDQTNDTKRKAEARTDEEYLQYRGLYKTRYHDYVRFRDLAKTLEGKVKVLSRTGGFKDEEQEAGDRSAAPKMRRRKAA